MKLPGRGKGGAQRRFVDAVKEDMQSVEGMV